MKSKIMLVLVLSLGLMTGLARAQESMTLDDVVARALEYNISVRRQSLALSTKERTMTSAWNALVPSLTAQAAIAKPNLTETDWTGTGTLSASVTLSPALVDSIKASRLAYEAGAISLEQVKREIERGVRKGWYQLLTAWEQVSVLETSWKNMGTSLEQTRIKQASGLASELDLLNARIKAEDARLKLETAKASYEQSLANFRQLLGLPLDSPTVFAFGSLEVPGNLSKPELNNQTSDTIRALLKSLESAWNSRTLLVKHNFLPALSLSWTWAPAATSPDFSVWNDRGSFTASLGLKLDPFLPGSAARVALSTADNTIKDIQLQLESARDTQKLETLKHLDSLESNLAALGAYQANLGLAERSWELTQEAYRRGTRDLLTLQSAEQALREARLQVINQKRTIIETLVDLEYTCGLPYGSIGDNP